LGAFSVNPNCLSGSLSTRVESAKSERDNWIGNSRELLYFIGNNRYLNSMNRILGPGEFYGTQQLNYDTPTGRFTEMVYSPSFRIARHAHERAFFGFVLEGGYQETFEQRQRECRPCTFLFHPEGERHSELHYETVVRIFCFEPAPNWLEKVRDRSGCLCEPFDSQGGPLARVAARLYDEFRVQDAFSSIAMEGLALELLATACRGQFDQESKPPRWLREIRDILHEQFSEDLSLGELASQVGIHPAHLARAFRHHYHCTVGDYVRDRRMAQARSQLVSSDLPLSELAHALGYSDQSHFSNTFKRHTGMTPGQFRKELEKR
jgi:AraC family transcriptional regulator